MKARIFVTGLMYTLLLVLSGFPRESYALDVKSITVAGLTDKIPLEYNTLNAKPAGAYIEIWNLWSDKTGIKVKYIITTGENAVNALMAGSVDVIMGYTAPDEKKSLIVIPGIYKTDVYIYHNRKTSSTETLDELKPYRTGITAVDMMNLGNVHSDISFFIKEDVSELIQSSISGEIIVFLAGEARTNHLLSKSGQWKNFVQSSGPAFSYGIPAVVRADRRELAQVISSGFSGITPAERLIIEKTWTGGNFKYRIPWGYIVTIIVIASIIAGVAAIWSWNYQLQKKIDEATDELKAMKEEAENASQAKSLFLDNISHELRTPLTLIIAPIEDAMNGRPLSADKLEMIHRNSRNLLSLINDLLDLSRITAGRLKLRISETDLGRAVMIYCREMESIAEYYGITLACSVPDEPLIVHIDRNKFSGILSNFFSNSLKFTGKGGNITVSLEKDNNEIVLRFCDTGPGIPPGKTDSIFDRFSQAETAASKLHEGTGIGLSIVKEIAELHGGSVSVESRYIEQHPDDHGTVFSVRVPSGTAHFKGRSDIEFVDSPANEPRNPHVRGIAARWNKDFARHRAECPDGEKSSVLIVEDNADMRFFLEELLGKDYDVYTALDGIEALDILGRVETIDLVLSDIMMPVMDGHELLRKIKADEKISGIPVLFLSARNDDLCRHTGLELGAVDYILKPFNPDELILRIRNQMQLRVIRNNLERRNNELYSRLGIEVQSDHKKLPVTDSMKVKMESVCSFIQQNFTSDLSRDLIASTIDMNPDLFSRLFNQHTGKTLPDYINSLRIAEAKKLLTETDKAISRVSIDTGFDNLRTFNRTFKKFTGMNPSEFREEKTR